MSSHIKVIVKKARNIIYYKLQGMSVSHQSIMSIQFLILFLFLTSNTAEAELTSPIDNTNAVNNTSNINPHAGSIFQDKINKAEAGPKMVVIPAGSFLMGSTEHEAGRYPDESPQHKVTFIKPFALGMTEITVAEFARFVKATHYTTDSEKYGGSLLRDPDPAINDYMASNVDWRHDHLGRASGENNPVIHLTWNDAKAYTEWLAQVSGQPYRLPTEAEFEYANRAGTETVYWWGDSSPSTPVSNLRGALEQDITPPQIWSFTAQERAHATKEGPTWYAFPGYNDGYGGLAPVGSFTANAFNLHDTTGNVWEWLEDCYVDSYIGAPTNGQPRLKNTCTHRVLRGGSYYCFPRHMRSANRWSRAIYTRGINIGFRVARDL